MENNVVFDRAPEKHNSDGGGDQDETPDGAIKATGRMTRLRMMMMTVVVIYQSLSAMHTGARVSYDCEKCKGGGRSKGINIHTFFLFAFYSPAFSFLNEAPFGFQYLLG